MNSKNKIPRILISKEIWRHLSRRRQKQLIILNPDKILERGYSVPFDQNGKIIRLPSQIDVGDIFKLKMAKGYISAKKESR